MRNERADKLRLHRMEFEVIVRSVSISIKFPCKLSLGLRIGKDESESDEECKLVDGSATFIKPLWVKSNLSFNPQLRTYQEKKSSFAVYIISTTGRNIAGVISFDASALANSSNGSQDFQNINLERCPDRGAIISYRIKCNFLQELEGIPSDNSSFTCTFPQQPRQDLFSISSPRERDRLDVRTNLPVPSKFADSNRSERRFQSNRVTIHGHDRDYSANSNQLIDDLEGQFSRSRISATRVNLTANRRREQGEFASQVATLKSELLDSDKKLTKLDTEKQNYLRENSQLKSQLESARNDKLTRHSRDSDLQAQIERLKKKIQLLEDTLENMKKSKLDMERSLNQKHILQKNEKTYVEEIQIKILRIEELQIESKSNKKAKDELDKLLKQKSRQLRDIQQKMSDYENSVSTVQKRCDMKDSFYKEQIRKYNQKLIESQQDKQRLNSEIAAMREGGEDSVRKLSLSLKEKQRLFAEERTKLTKKYEQLHKDFERIELERVQQRETFQSQFIHIEKRNKDLTATEYDKIGLMEEVERLRNQLTSQALYKSKFEQCLKEKNILSQQRTTLERQLTDERRQKTDSHSTIIKQNSDLNHQIRSLSQQLSDLQKRLKEKEYRNNQSQQQCEALRKRVENFKRSQEKRTSQIEDKKIAQKSLLAQNKTLNDTIHELERLLTQNKQKSEFEIDALRKSLKKVTQQSEQTRFKLTVSSENQQRLQLELDSYREKEINLADKGSKLEQRLKKYKQDIDFRDSNIRQLNQQVMICRRNLDQSRKQLSLTKSLLSESEQRLFKLSTELSQTHQLLETSQFSTTQHITRITKQLKEKQSELTVLYEEQTKLEITVSQLESQMNASKQELKVRNAEISKERMTSDLLKREFNQIKEDKLELEGVLKVRGDELLQLKKTTGQTSVDKSRIEEHLNNSRQQFQKFKKGNLQTLRILLEQINKQTMSVDRVLQALIDYETSAIQVQIMKAVRALSQANSNNSSTLTQQMSSLQKDLLNERARSLEKQSSLQHHITLKQQQFSYFKQSMQLEKQNLQEAITIQSERLEQTHQDILELTSERNRIEVLHKKILLENEEISAKYDHVVRKLQNVQSELSGLITELSIEKREKEEIRGRLQAERNESDRRLQGTEKQLQIKLYRLQNQLTHQASRNEELQAQIRTLKQESDSKSLALRLLEEKLELIQSELHEKELDVSSGQKRQKDTIERARQLQQSLLREETQVAKSRLSLKQLQQKLKQLELNQKSLEKEKNSLLKKNQLSETELLLKDQIIASVSQQLHEQQDQADDLRLRLVQLQTTKTTVSEDGLIKTRQLNEMTKQLDGMKDRFTRLEKEITLKAEEIVLLKETNEREGRRLGDQIEELQTSVQISEGSCRKEQQARQKIQRQMEDLIQEQQNVREQLEKQISQLNQQVFHHSSEVNTLRLKQQQDIDVLKQLQSDRAALQILLADATRQLEQKELYINVEVSNKEKDYYELRKKLQDKATQMERALNDSKELNKKYEQTLADLRKKYDDEVARLRESLRVIIEEKRSNQSNGNAVVEEMEFNNQRLQSDLQELQKAAHQAELESVKIETELLTEIQKIKKQGKNRQMALNSQLQNKLEQIRKLNDALNAKTKENETIQASLLKERQSSSAASKLNEEKHKQHQQELVNLQNRLEDSLRLTNESSQSQQKELVKQAERKLNQFKLKATEEQQALKSELIELEIKLHATEKSKEDLQKELKQLESRLAQTLESMRANQKISDELKNKLGDQEKTLQYTESNWQQTEKLKNQQVSALETKYQQTIGKLEQTTSELKTLKQTKTFYNPAHCYIQKILQSVELYHSEKQQLLIKISKLQKNIRKQSERSRILTNELNTLTDEKTRILDRLRELSIMVLKSKSKALSKTRTQAESKLVVEEYKLFQDKIIQILEYSTSLFQMERNQDTQSQSSHSVSPMQNSGVKMRNFYKDDQVTETRTVASKRISK